MSEIKITDYDILEKIGCGSYSIVYKGQKKTTKEIFALKCVDKSTLSKSAIDNIITEIRLLKTLKHKHIVEMKDFMWDEKNIYIIMEYCNAGDLSTLIKRRHALPEKTCRMFLQQLADAIKYMRANNVSHFDLKPQNLLLTRSPNITLKVADFGFAQHMNFDQENTNIKGSPLYMAPEILLKQRYSATADLWSIGVILYECLFSKAPYSSKTLGELLEKIKIKQKIEIPKNGKISPEIEDLLTRLLQHEPDKRITFEQFFDHEILDLKHLPSEENMERAINLITLAVEADTNLNYKDAYFLYCDALQYFVPIILDEPDVTRKMALRSRAKTYLQRAEEIKQSFILKNNNNNNNGKTDRNQCRKMTNIEAALIPNLNYQQLYSITDSSPALKNGLDIGRQGELYAYEGRNDVALESFKSALGILVPLLYNEPKGGRRELLHKQIMDWMKEAESLKSLTSAQQLDTSDTDLETINLCSLQ